MPRTYRNFCLPNIFDDCQNLTKIEWKRLVKKAVYSEYENQCKSQISGSSTLKDGPMTSEHFEEKQYSSDMSMHDARLLFRIRSKTNDVRMNQQSDNSNAMNIWKCSECGNFDTQSHVIWCPYLANLREGKSLKTDEDLVAYFREVFKIVKINFHFGWSVISCTGTF